VIQIQNEKGPPNRYRWRCSWQQGQPIKLKKPKDMTRFEMRLDRKLKAEAEKAAAEDNRSLAGLIVKLLRDYLKKTKPPKQ
jgi:hypothetical protein